MPYLVDTNVLLRMTDHFDVMHPVANRAVLELHRMGERLHITPQIVIEFRSSCTRPKASNGLGFSTSQVDSEIVRYESMFPMLDDAPGIYMAWKSIVSRLGVIGKQVHDARLVAVCHTYAVTHVLTFNVRHFTRFATHVPGIIPVHPNTI